MTPPKGMTFEQWATAWHEDYRRRHGDPIKSILPEQAWHARDAELAAAQKQVCHRMSCGHCSCCLVDLQTGDMCSACDREAEIDRANKRAESLDMQVEFFKRTFRCVGCDPDWSVPRDNHGHTMNCYEGQKIYAAFRDVRIARGERDQLKSEIEKLADLLRRAQEEIHSAICSGMDGCDLLCSEMQRKLSVIQKERG
jgi:hypothetical protein